MKNWYTIKAQGEKAAEILIYDDIGYYGIRAKDFMRELKALGAVEKITIRIHSDGGDFFDALAIYNDLKFHPAEVTAIIDGLAASAASLIAMAADKVIMPENAWLFVHNVIGGVIGNADDFREVADLFDRFQNSLVSAYRNKSKQSDKDIIALLDEDSWIDAKQALEIGFADEISEAIQVAAKYDLSRFKNPPAALLESPLPSPSPVKGEGTDTDPDPKSPSPQPTALSPEEIRAAADSRAREIVALCTKAGVADAAAEYLEKGLTVDQVKAKLADASKIRARCVAAKLADRANAYIKAGMSVGEVANELFDVLLARQGPEIDNKLGPDGERHTATAAPVVNIAEIYKKRNQRKG